MRITDSSTAASSLHNLHRQTEARDRLMRELSSGRRILTDSDHPLDAEEVQNLRRQLAYMTQYERNANRSEGLLKFGDATLAQVGDTLLEAIQIGAQGASQLVQPGDRVNLANRVRSIKTQIVALANSTYEGQFIFGGSQNLQVPFTVNPGTGAVTFNGNGTGRLVPVFESVDVQATFSGQGIFLTATDLFAALDRMAAAIETGDSAQVALELQEVEKGRVAITDTRAKMGLQLNLIDNVKLQLDRSREILLQRASELEDADVAAVISQLTLHETAIQATLFAQGSLVRRSLFDFLA